MRDDTENADSRSGFVRQRRFLIGTSLAILGYQFLGLSMDQVSVLGNSAVVAKPERLAVVLVLVHVWAIYRYWAYFQELAPWREFRDGRLSRWRQVLMPSDFSARRREGEGLTQFCALYAEEIERLRSKERIGPDATPANAHLIKVEGSCVSDMREEWNIPFHSPENGQQVGYLTLNVPIGKWKARRTCLRAWLYVLANRIFFSEYFVPLGLSVLAFGVIATSAFSALSR